MAVDDMTTVSPNPGLETPGLEGACSLPCPGCHMLLACAAGNCGIWTDPALLGLPELRGMGCCKGHFLVIQASRTGSNIAQMSQEPSLASSPGGVFGDNASAQFHWASHWAG